MKNMTQKLRLKRYQFQPKSKVRFTVDTQTGTKTDLTPIDCSLSGIGAYLTDKEILPELKEGTILPASKLHWEGHEYTLGRLVIRVIKNQGENCFVGFSTIDCKVPVDGPLSQFLKIDLNDKKTPYDFEASPDHFSPANFNDGNTTNVDIFARTQQYQIYKKDWTEHPKYGYYNVRTPSMGTRVKLDRKRSGNRSDYIIMGSNDYLGLAAHPDVIKAAKKAIDDFGFGSTGSPLTTGITTAHEELCELLAGIFKKPKAILFNSGYTANVGIIAGLTQSQDLIVSDMLSHASIRDGMLMSPATSRFFKHNDPKHLEKVLQENRAESNGCLVITEGVFSMDGDVPPLKKIVEVAKKYNARTMVDEAHSFGVVGEKGLGAIEKFNLQKEVDIVMGTFSKIAGGIGGFVVSSEEVCDWLWWFARSHMFTVSIPPSTAAAATAAIKILLNNSELLAQLHQNIKHFVGGLNSLGFNLNPNHESAVVPVLIGDEKKMGIMNKIFMDAGIFCVPIVYPAVSKKSCRFRFTVMANHTISDLDYVISIMEKAIQAADLDLNDSPDYLPTDIAV